MSFNPIKEDKQGKSFDIKWSTDALTLALKGMEQGKKLVANPFYENKTYLLKGDIVFVRTKEEIAEWKRCKKDILYFAEKYCKLMTPEGIKNIVLRDYQAEYLKHLQDNRLSIFLSCRQSGKCVLMLSDIQCIIDDENCQHIKGKIKKLQKTYSSNKEDNSLVIPMFELYNLYDTSLKWKIEYRIYKLLYKLIHQKGTDRIINNLIYVLSILDKNTINSEEKLIKSFSISGIKVKTDTGYKPISHIHLTKAYKVHKIKLDNGYHLECADNHICYTPDMQEKFIKDFQVGDYIMTDDGSHQIIYINIMRSSICMCDITVDDDNHRFYSNGILSHNTTTSAIFMLWYILFNVDKNSLVLGNKRKTAVEILDKVKKIYEALPHFLKPGVYKWNEAEIVFDNGCRCMAEATTINSGISFTFHCVLADEFAHIPENIKESFYNNLFPTITAAKARFMITSTQNGVELFSQIYTAAVNRENEYAPFKVDWQQVPEWNEEKRCFEPRTEEWHRLQVGNLGSEEAFQKQFGTAFAIPNSSLVSSKILMEHGVHAKQYDVVDMPGLYGAQYFHWKPGYDIHNLKNDFIVCTIDISEGVNQDSTIAQFNKILNISENGRPIIDNIGYFKTNTLDDLECCEILYNFYRLYMNPQRYLISLEYNLYGELWVNHFKTFIDRDNPNNFSMDNFVKYYNETMTKYRFGVRITSSSKKKACKLFKSDYEKGYILNTSVEFNSELRNFGDKNNNGTFAALFGHDDMVMAEIQLELAMESLQFKHFLEDFQTYNHTSYEDNNINFYNEFRDYNRSTIDSPYDNIYKKSIGAMYSLDDLIPDNGMPNKISSTMYDF